VKFPYLQRGLTRSERDDLLEAEAESLGFVFLPWKRSFSITLPWGVIYLSRPAALHVKAHELVHARRMGRGWRRWWWAFLYLLLPSSRQREEVEAEGMEAAFYTRWVEAPDYGVGAYISAPALGTWKLPYLMGGDREALIVEATEIAADLLAGSR
jgi:hypothetical protein